MKRLSFAFVYMSLFGFGFCPMILGQGPANDSVCQAIMLPVDGSIGLYSNIGAGVEPNEQLLEQPPASGGGDDGWNDPLITVSVWFTFVAPASGSVEIDLCNGGAGGTNFDTQLAVYEADSCGDFASFTWLAGNDDLPNCPNPSPFASYLALNCLDSGKVYHLLLDGWAGETGQFGIRLSEIPAEDLSVRVSGKDPSCPGSQDGSVIASFKGGGRPFMFAWEGGDSLLLERTNLGAGTYVFAVSDGCGSLVEDSIQLNDPISPLLPNAGQDTGFCEGASIQIGAMSAGGFPRNGLQAYSVDLAAGGSLLKHRIQDPAMVENRGTGLGPGIFSGDLVEGQFLLLSDTWDQLLSANPIDGSFQIIGAAGKFDSSHVWTGLAYDEAHQILYGLSTDGAQSRLYVIDPVSGTATPGPVVPLPVPIWLAADTSGLLYALDVDSDRIYQIDTQTGGASPIGLVGFDASFAQDADFDPLTNELYLAAYPNGGQGSLLRKANLTTGLCPAIGLLAQTTEVGAFALGYEPEAPYDYFWSPPLALDDPFAPMPVSSTPVSISYTLTLTDQCDQLANDSIWIEVWDRPALSMSSEADAGNGEGSASVQINGGFPPFSLEWETGDTSTSIHQLVAGWYEVQVEDANGCIGIDSVEVALLNSLNSGQEPELRIYPNPVSSTEQLHLRGIRTGIPIQIWWYDLVGKLLAKESLVPTSEEVGFPVPMDIPRGSYTLIIQQSSWKIPRLVRVN